MQVADLQRDGDPISQNFVLSRPLTSVNMCLNSFFFIMWFFLPFCISTFFLVKDFCGFISPVSQRWVLLYFRSGTLSGHCPFPLSPFLRKVFLQKAFAPFSLSLFPHPPPTPLPPPATLPLSVHPPILLSFHSSSSSYSSLPSLFLLTHKGSA